MQTADLIDSLAADIALASPHAGRSHMALALLGGGAVSLGAVIAHFGIQPDLGTLAHGGPLAMKEAYAGSLAAIGFAFALTLSHPGVALGRAWKWIAVPLAALALLALFELSRAPRSAWPAMMLGGSWRQCPWRIAVLSIPIFAGLCLAIRKQAPTHLRAAGAAAGLLSGAAAATVYAFACVENTAAFVSVWYTLGIAASTSAGALLGPRLLRW